MIPESQNAIALALEIGRPPIVCRALGMLPAIDFDNHLERMTCEVAEIRTDRRLAPKVCSLNGGCRKRCHRRFSASVISRRSARARGTRASGNEGLPMFIHPPPPPPPPPPPSPS